MLVFRMLRVFRILAIAAVCASPVLAAENRETPRMLTDGSARVFYYGPLEKDARIVLGMSAGLLKELAQHPLGLLTDIRPDIVLVNDHGMFVEASGTGLISAFANGGQGAIVIDYSHVLKEPGSMRSMLKHELAHLALHRTTSGNMPRWLNEGLAVWLSDGYAEMLAPMRGAALENAALGDALIPLSSLADGFPADSGGLRLAYEESESAVRYMHEQYGAEGLKALLMRLGSGSSIDEASRAAFGAGIGKIEEGWRGRIRGRSAWIGFLSNYMYEIIFAALGVLLVFGFLRALYRIRTYRDDDGQGRSDDDPPGAHTRRAGHMHIRRGLHDEGVDPETGLPDDYYNDDDGYDDELPGDDEQRGLKG